MDENADLSLRRVVINNPGQTKCAVMFLEGVTNQQLIEQDILQQSAGNILQGSEC